MTNPYTLTVADDVTAAGQDPCVPRWDIQRDHPHVPVERFGKDHWLVLAHAEHMAVDERGRIDPDRMRTDPSRHMVFASAQVRVRLVPSFDPVKRTFKYPTRLKSVQPRDDGTYGADELDMHDDWDCLDDLVAAGLVEIVMPVIDEQRGEYVGPEGRPVLDPDRQPIPVGLLSGMAEDWLMVRARVRLTERGRVVAAALRAHKADGRNPHQFQPPADGTAA